MSKVLFWIFIVLSVTSWVGIPIAICLLREKTRKCKQLEFHLDWIIEHDNDISVKRDEKGDITEISVDKNITI